VIKTGLLIVLTLALSNIKAQTIPCSSFCVTGIEMDSTVANTMNVTIFMAGSGTDFINYPYVSLIKNSNGDTIATGTMNFFGQFGNTSQTYSATTTLGSIPVNFNGTVNFNYDTLICVLPYPCSTSGISNDYFPGTPKIYPNPSNGKFQWFVDDAQSDKNYTIEIYNGQGEKIYQYEITGTTSDIDLSQQANGIYLARIYNRQTIFTQKIAIQ
jgi:hypothetical protein